MFDFAVACFVAVSLYTIIESMKDREWRKFIYLDFVLIIILLVLLAAWGGSI